MNDVDVLTGDEACALLQCDIKTLEDKARNGELPGVKIGRSWIFPRQALLHRLNEMALGPKRTKGFRAAEERLQRMHEDAVRREKVKPFAR